ncbi:MAG: hypothetical protein V7739_22165 [Motiliproteus sp.]
MNKRKMILTQISIGAIYTLMVATPMIATEGGSGQAFNQMLGTMMSRDTGSMWFDRYVDTLNQELAEKDSIEPFGAAGPEGPVTGFEGYVKNFSMPDTGSVWLNGYVHEINHVIQQKQYRQ